MLLFLVEQGRIADAQFNNAGRDLTHTVLPKRCARTPPHFFTHTGAMRYLWRQYWQSSGVSVGTCSSVHSKPASRSRPISTSEILGASLQKYVNFPPFFNNLAAS